MSLELEIPELDLNDPAILKRFDELQQRLVPLWRLIQSLDDHGEQTIVVVPSLTVDFAALQGSVLQAYEERFLFLLLLLRQPRARLIYVTSQPVQPSVIDYYLGLLPGVISSHARARLHLVAPHDGAPQPLSVKLLQRPRLIARIRELIPDRSRAHLVPFNTTAHEQQLALRLGIPMYAADPRHNDHGTKSGCRKLFKQAGISLPAGHEDLQSLDDLVSAVAELRRSHPYIRSAMVKTNDGVSGDGNALLRLEGLDADSRDAVEERLRSELKPESKGLDFESFLARFVADGGIVEERVVGDPIESPSVQLRNTPLGKVELLSTHDQLLSGSKFIGCTFPANTDYAALIARESLKVGELLKAEGVLGRYAIDYVCGLTADGWHAYAIELNLRKGGTTHPFLTLQFLTGGSYDPETAEFVTSSGAQKHYLATDNLASPRYRVFTPDDIFDIAVRRGLHFDPTRQTGAVFHMLPAVGDHGRLGLTAVGNSAAEAKELYDRTVEALDLEASLALEHGELPTLE